MKEKDCEPLFWAVITLIGVIIILGISWIMTIISCN